ncbi:MAG: TolC family protein [Bdellovibrionales bacterium]|nr:TolC family protein [Bdellovibrionales bacterium]
MFKFAKRVASFKSVVIAAGGVLAFSVCGEGVAAPLKLSPQDVVDLALKQSPEVKQAELQAQMAEGSAERDRGPYDLIFKLSPSYEYTEALTLAGTGNPNDRTMTLASSLSKQFSTGTNLTLEFNRISQESTLSSFTANLRKPRAAMDTLTLTIRQALWRNILGEADRAVLRTADAKVLSARLTREEKLEEAILSALSLYWNAYVAETQLKENTAARQKYEELVRAVRRKAGFNLSTPGELPRLEAEFAAADARVKISSQQYLAALDNLRTALRIESKEPIVFQASATTAADIPAIPSLKEVDVTRLRPMLVSELTRENADRGRAIANSANRPRLDLVARARSTGVDETSDLSFSKMTSGSQPTYVVGVELEWPLDSSAFRGARAEAEANYQLAEVSHRLTLDRIRDSLADVERRASAFRENALSSIEVVNKRGRVVSELERSYRQGRTPLVELIRSFNELFVSQQERAAAVGNYMIALNQWASMRDELVKSTVDPEEIERAIRASK